ncbi:MAG: ribosome maturation factor RimM [Desulfovibrionales bacterium]
MNKARMMALGRVVRPHGLKGEVRIHSYADSPFVFEEVPALFLQKEGARPKRVHLVSMRHHHRGLLLKFEEIQGLDQAETWRGSMIMARYRDLPALDPEDILYVDLIGRRVFLEDGSLLGVIEQIQDNAGQEVWTIRGSGGDEILFPAVESFILRCEKDEGEVRIDPPPGLLELYIPSSPSPGGE